MAWTTPPDFTTGLVVTEQEMDTLSACLLAAAHTESISGTVQLIESSTTETAILSHTLPAGRLGTDRCLRYLAFGDYEYNGNVGDNLTFRLAFGAQVLTLVVDSSNQSSTRYQWRLEAFVANVDGVNNKQKAQMWFYTEGTAPLADTGTREIRAEGLDAADWTVDTSVNVVTGITAQWEVSDADNSLRKSYGLVELLGS